MSDSSNTRTEHLDQLRAGCVYEVQMDLQAEDGRILRRGSKFRFEYAVVNAAEGKTQIHGVLKDGVRVAVRSVEWAHVKWFTFFGHDWKLVPANPKYVNEVPPQDSGEAEWRRWLAGHQDFRRASAILSGNYSNENWGSARSDADVLRAAANALRYAHLPMARWLASQSLHHYHSWMAQATSGGEGTAMSNSIRDELKEMRALEVEE